MNSRLFARKPHEAGILLLISCFPLCFLALADAQKAPAYSVEEEARANLRNLEWLGKMEAARQHAVLRSQAAGFEPAGPGQAGQLALKERAEVKPVAAAVEVRRPAHLISPAHLIRPAELE
ncbi:MAG: hypothetical protein GWO24_04120, partial [Akkermansiaceae bacterium]|nr:hypothetical protein [Akkermansiaceae bacterium]